eukprot:TRINITY_DN1354_c0_g1_i3.p2 TRINITY_DN1354_c0_g1~~TRINITY_DN1354_c0_g1_i3.p2  ORF type:complete len:440 (+),score=172.50 TRINITY_DN1354_c0_g1_i3:107-1426(+)
MWGTPAVVKRHELPEQQQEPEQVLRHIKSLIAEDGHPNMNLGTFVTTEMDAEAEELMALGARINIIDQGEYPAHVEIHDRCLSIIANLWNVPVLDGGRPTGTATVGSSEACILAGLALKRRWRDRQRRLGKPAGEPNLVLGSNYQICWGKFCNYFDVEQRVVPCTEGSLVLTADTARQYIDENTIGVVAILGSTFNGEYEDVRAMDRMVAEVRSKHGWDVPIHVDAASGGFVAPFSHPELEWDFRLPNVRSINASGHKYGMAYAGVGWLVFRGPEDLPKDIVFTHSYLAGGEQESLTLNFSKGAGPILAQYYQLLKLGHEGYAQTMQGARETAERLRRALRKLGNVDILDRGHLPVVAFQLIDDSSYTVYELAEQLLAKGWKVPAYPLPEGRAKGHMMRVVVRPSFSPEMADRLAADFGSAVDALMERGGGLTSDSNSD